MAKDCQAAGNCGERSFRDRPTWTTDGTTLGQQACGGLVSYLPKKLAGRRAFGEAEEQVGAVEGQARSVSGDDVTAGTATKGTNLFVHTNLVLRRVARGYDTERATLSRYFAALDLGQHLHPDLDLSCCDETLVWFAEAQQTFLPISKYHLCCRISFQCIWKLRLA
jgi:hypothetical protein